MDSRTPLDYALFQLTPTRTRCDLVICAGEVKEKIASGLLAPFLAHLQSARDQISRGGYSITLSASGSWFAKSTLERFVRFVSTPEVLERFVTIEKEIAQIDHSISQTAYGLVPDDYSNKSSNSPYKPEFIESNEAVHEEDSKVQLQRALEARRAALQKEQAMVYARALVAGFESDYLEDLICFADAFGSPRLRDACLSFVQLCNSKSHDRVWMDEVAAMQQLSYVGPPTGILLASDDDPVPGLTTNITNENGSHVPRYLHNLNGPMFYHGYPPPNMPVPPYYRPNLAWPQHVDGLRTKGSRRDDDFGSSGSSSRSDSGDYRTGPSRKVIVENVNYIGPEKDTETESESRGGETLVDGPEKGKATEQWGTFENLLMVDAGREESPDKQPCDGNESRVKNVSLLIQKFNGYEEQTWSHKFGEPKGSSTGALGEYGSKSSYDEGDWFIGGKETEERSRDVFDDHFRVQPVESTKDVLVDDPLAVQDRSVNPTSGDQPETDNMVTESNLVRKLQEKGEPMQPGEPEDLHMVLERDTGDPQGMAAWVPEMEYENGLNKIVKSNSDDEAKNPPACGDKAKNRSNGSAGPGLERKGSTAATKSKPLVGSPGKSKSEHISRNKKWTGTRTKEDENRKKMEELARQRQKRIAERSAKSAKSDKPRPQPGPKAITVKTDSSIKPKAQTGPGPGPTRKSYKPTVRSSTITRVIEPKVPVTELKPGNKPKPTNPTKKEHGAARAAKKTAGSDKAQRKQQNVGPKKPIGLRKPKNSEPKTPPGGPCVKKTENRAVDFEPSKDAMVCAGNGGCGREKASHGSPEKASHGSPESARGRLSSGSFKIDRSWAEEQPIVKVNTETFVSKVSTPPPDRNDGRKKWDGGETTPKALSGLKKLLFFGRRR